MTISALLKRPSGFVPLVMSGTALAMIGGYVAMYGVTTSEDEGAAAHIFQLLMLGQVFVMGGFAAKWLPRAPRPALVVLALQATAWVVPVAVIVYLEGL